MKIMYCITSASWGGAQLNVLELCQNQISRGNSVIFVVGNEGPLLNKVRNIDGVKVILMKSLHREVNFCYDIRAIFELRMLLKKERPDILHLHSSKAGTLGRVAAIGLPVKTVFTVHGWAFTEGIGSRKKQVIFRLIERTMEPFTDLFICVSKFDYEIGLNKHVLKARNKKAIVVHNGAPQSVSITPEDKKIHNPLRFVMTARFSEQKDQETLIKALNDNKMFDFEMVFVGDGSTFQKNMKLCEDLGLVDKIKFVGFKNDVTNYLRRSDVYVLSTLYEGLPISIIEAMSYGLPVIASEVGGNAELVKNGYNGFLVKRKDYKDLAEKLKYFLLNPSQAGVFGENSLKIYTEDFSLNEMLDRVNSEYAELVKSNK